MSGLWTRERFLSHTTPSFQIVKNITNATRKNNGFQLFATVTTNSDNNLHKITNLNFVYLATNPSFIHF